MVTTHPFLVERLWALVEWKRAPYDKLTASNVRDYDSQPYVGGVCAAQRRSVAPRARALLLRPAPGWQEARPHLRRQHVRRRAHLRGPRDHRRLPPPRGLSPGRSAHDRGLLWWARGSARLPDGPPRGIALVLRAPETKIGAVKQNACTPQIALLASNHHAALAHRRTRTITRNNRVDGDVCHEPTGIPRSSAAQDFERLREVQSGGGYLGAVQRLDAESVVGRPPRRNPVAAFGISGVETRAEEMVMSFESKRKTVRGGSRARARKEGL